MSAERTVSQWNDDSKQATLELEAYQGTGCIQTKGSIERHEAIFRRIESDKKQSSKAKPLVFNFSLAIIIWFYTVLGASIWLVQYPAIMLLFYVLASAVTYSVYAFDKEAVRHQTLGVNSGILHLLSLAGGWPGALFAQCVFNHRYQDKWFASVFWLTVVFNFLAFVWTFTDVGNGYLMSAVQYLKMLLR
ncbi:MULTISPECIES: DUF1294 domain-containing protein [Vibrio]|uniref:DUF1294 domain-containing protein n=1 Tax=Vibrio TaxID=662 RepID=UPI00142EAA13|nr:MULTISPECIES: DUF1294 domain-containing protein [Vibrio]